MKAGRVWENVYLPKLKEKGVKNVTLMPLMMVAGDHANNDMAGDEEDSHKTILQKEGFKVNTYIHGIGENKTCAACLLNMPTKRGTRLLQKNNLIKLQLVI